jgi:hypothetical protein
MQTATPLSFEEAVEHAELTGCLELENARLINLVRNERGLQRRIFDTRREIVRLAGCLRDLERQR